MSSDLSDRWMTVKPTVYCELKSFPGQSSLCVDVTPDHKSPGWKFQNVKLKLAALRLRFSLHLPILSWGPQRSGISDLLWPESCSGSSPAQAENEKHRTPAAPLTSYSLFPPSAQQQFSAELFQVFVSPPPLCRHITPWSQRAEGCRFSSRRVTLSREPAAPGWWSSCPGCGDSSSSWSSSGSAAGCCFGGSPDGGRGGLSGMSGGCQRLLLVMRCLCMWNQKQVI